MNTRIIALAAGLLLAGGAAAYIVFSGHGKPKPKHARSDTHGSDVHVEGVDRASAPVDAMFQAPEGKTPCETLWIAIQAEQDTAKAQDKHSRFTFVAAHDDFFTRCEALPKESQPCLTPRYASHNRDACLKLRVPEETIATLFKVKPPEDAIDQLEKLEKLKRQAAQLKLEQDQAKQPAPPGQSVPAGSTP